ncbi:hypothetical protein UFOVP363_16 [uncultured Caudovirales phage]|uniref:Uncharacterized protein n=1 Tax=uncultured Caudovirales phage TaxID=2100421 RepID=A0A6J7WVY8_9CAUD|nr:hypothetical protein UFOVP363_16 [uncultured Caudovirales phage]
MQLSLFGDLSIPEIQLSRTTDPETSKAGAKSIRIRGGSQRAKLLLAFLDGFDRFPMSDEYAAKAARLYTVPNCGWWKRCSDLRKLGLIVPVGKVVSKTTGEEVMVSEITEAGIVLALELLENK